MQVSMKYRGRLLTVRCPYKKPARFKCVPLRTDSGHGVEPQADHGIQGAALRVAQDGLGHFASQLALR